MKSNRNVREPAGMGRIHALFLLLATLACLSTLPRAAAANLVVWDTLSPLADTLPAGSSSTWKAVPSDLLILEADPPKASSDPGYYGREYAFQGDAVVENRRLAAVFWSSQGRVAIYAKDAASLRGGVPPPTAGFGKNIAEFTLLKPATQPVRISRFEILRNAADTVVLKVSFSTSGFPDAAAVFVFDKTEILEIQPAENLKSVRLSSPLEYGIVPGFIGDDLIFSPTDYPDAKNLYVPTQNLFVGLLKGEDSQLVMTWPKGNQQMRLRLSPEPQGKRLIESLEFDDDGQSLYLAATFAPGIWHREALTSAYLEKDIPVQWRRPFPAKWTTQLYEGEVKTTFAFRESKGDIWRGVPGSYHYPVWFEGDTASYHLSKKIPPKGESVIYFLEGKDSPLAISTPVEILKETLGRPLADSILDLTGHQLRTHHRRGGAGVRRACTCGCTEAIQAIFEAGEEAAKKDAIAGDVDDMIYFVQRHLERIDEYQRFAAELIKFLRAQHNSAPELQPYLDGLEQVAGQIPQEYDVQKENMKSLAHAHELEAQTLALAAKKDPHNLSAYMDLLKAWREMGGAQDYVVAQCHTITRKLSQAAGYGCTDQPKAVAVAEEVRQRCRQALRNPDGYEIWADY
jgi:hypothetical protein